MADLWVLDLSQDVATMTSLITVSIPYATAGPSAG
jgi:hypothetical protein